MEKPHNDRPHSLWKRVISLPRTRLGWWSLGFVAVHALFLTMWFALVDAGLRGGETFFSNLWLAIPLLAMGVSALAAGTVALFGVIRRGERSILMIVSLVYGLLVLLFWLGEVLDGSH